MIVIVMLSERQVDILSPKPANEISWEREGY